MQVPDGALPTSYTQRIQQCNNWAMEIFRPAFGFSDQPFP